MYDYVESIVRRMKRIRFMKRGGEVGPFFALGLFVLCVVMTLPGCFAAKKTPQALRLSNSQQDMARLESGAGSEQKASKAEDIPSRTEEAGKTQAGTPAGLTGPLTLDNCVRYALENNLEALVAEQERAVREEMTAGAAYRLLPSLMIDAEQSWKSQETPVSSKSYETRTTSVEPSISSDLHTSITNATLSWDLLNLAVNVYKWRAAGKQALAAGEVARRAKQNAILKVTESYYRAVVAADVAEKAASLIRKAEKRGAVIKKEVEEDILSKLDGLQNQVDIVEMRIRFQSYRDAHLAALARLREVMGLPQDAPIELAKVDFMTPPETINLDYPAMEREALQKRPELYERDYQEGVSLDEADAARAKMFPSLTPFARYTHDDNSYMLRHDWYVVGLRLSWDLLAIPAVYAERQAALRQAELERRRRLLMTVAVMTQTRLAALGYHDAMDKLSLTIEMVAKRRALMKAVAAHVREGKLHESLLLDEDQNFLVAWRLMLETYAAAATGAARIRNAMGLDYGETAETLQTASSGGAGEPGPALTPDAQVAPSAASAAPKAAAAPAAAQAPEAAPASPEGLRLMAAKEAVNVRSGPGTGNAVARKLYKGDAVLAGRPSGEWLAVFSAEASDGAKALGYVYAPLLAPKSGASPASPAEGG